MLEIIAIAILYTRLKKKLEKNGRPTGLAWLGPGLWIGGELAGAALGVAFAVMQNRQPGPEVYLFAIVGAIVGAVVAYLIVSSQGPMSFECPSCGDEFTHRPNPQGKSRCPHCGASLRVMGGMVHVVRMGKKD